MNTINTPYFNGYRVLSDNGPLSENGLLANEEVLSKFMTQYNRVVALRFELKFPVGYVGRTDIISKFLDSLRWKINNDLIEKSQTRQRCVQSEVGHVWAYELSSQDGWHYHVVLFLNYDVYAGFGKLYSHNTNMFGRIFTSWASAMGLNLKNEEENKLARGLVHIPENAVYKIFKNSPTLLDDIHLLLTRLSYFTKLATKPYGKSRGNRYFGTSRR